jgi:hypothetical protein
MLIMQFYQPLFPSFFNNPNINPLLSNILSILFPHGKRPSFKTTQNNRLWQKKGT